MHFGRRKLKGVRKPIGKRWSLNTHQECKVYSYGRWGCRGALQLWESQLSINLLLMLRISRGKKFKVEVVWTLVGALVVDCTYGLSCGMSWKGLQVTGVGSAHVSPLQVGITARPITDEGAELGFGRGVSGAVGTFGWVKKKMRTMNQATAALVFCISVSIFLLIVTDGGGIPSIP